MNTKQKIKLYIVAALLGAGLAFEITKAPSVRTVFAEENKKSVTVSAPISIPTPTATPSPIPTAVPEYSLENGMRTYVQGEKPQEYASYVWSKWAGYGNRMQAVAFCTNIAEGHFDDSATHINPGNGTDRGCWQWNDLYHPDVSDDVARNCYKATDLTYDTWKYRMSLGVQDGFNGMWYGYGSNNYNLCMKALKI